MGNRQESAARTREKLVEAGREIVHEKGITGTSVEEITEKAGVSKGTFYTYFRRKEDLVVELSCSMFGEILENAVRSEGDFQDRLENYMVNFSGYIQEGGINLARDWIRNVVDPRFSDDDNYSGKLRFDISSARMLIKSGVDDGLLRKDIPEEKTARIITEALYGQLLCWGMSGGTYSLSERAEELCRMCAYPIFKEYIIKR